MKINAQTAETARHFPLEQIIERYGIKLRGKVELVGACPRCGAGDDRFAINTRKRKWLCRRCEKGGSDAISLVRFLLDCDFATAVTALAGETTWAPGKEAAKPRPMTIGGEPHGKDDQQLWRRIWKDAGHACGTPVEQYLTRRHLTLPPGCDCVRFHRRCPFGKDDAGRAIYTPAMVALVSSIVTNEPQAVHRTALDMTGRKVNVGGRDRMALGPIAGGAVKLTADENVTIAIGVAEGIETALSLQRIPEWAGSPVWSLLNANGVANFPVLAGIETLVVAVDHDDAGEKAALAVAGQWRAAAREILLFEAVNPDHDLNDVIGE
jgi:hypothetical protein